MTEPFAGQAKLTFSIDIPESVSESSTTIALLGAGLVGIGFGKRRQTARQKSTKP